MGKMKFKKRRANGEAQVMIVTPAMLNYMVDVRMATFVASACARGLAMWLPTPARSAEDGRNQIFRESLAMTDIKITHFFLLDADSFPYEPFMIERLLAYGKKAIAGPTPTQRQGPDRYIFNSVTGAAELKGAQLRRLWNIVLERSDGKLRPLKRSNNPDRDELPSGLFKCRYVGGTGLLVERSIIEQMEHPWQKTIRGPEGQTILSEDYYFCDQIHKLGHNVWIDPKMKCGHNNSIDIGNYE